MIIERIWPGNAWRNFHYLIACGETGEAMAVDPLDWQSVHAAALRHGWTITHILNTHEHGDHIGGNDGLRGLPLETSRANLERMIVLSKDAGAQVLLLGMKIPPNYGARYSEGFEKVFRDLARQHRLAFEPFFLSKIALEPGMIQADGLHPTAKAQPMMLETMWPALRPLLQR